jgi:hypothetical protein
MDTSIECFGLQLRGDQLVGRRVEVPLSGHPDHDAATAIGLPVSRWDGVAVLHSTSWRCDTEAGALVLTYVCCPDPGATEDGGEPVVIARADDPEQNPSRPSPAGLSPGAVLHHGVRHLAWLAEHQATLVRTSRQAAPHLWEAILATGPARAGQLAQPHHIGATGAETASTARA